MDIFLNETNRKLYEKAVFINEEEKIYKGLPIEKKDIVLSYLKSFTPEFATSRILYDEVMHCKVEGFYDVGYFDGVYSWDEKDIYHFEKYDMPLKREFIDYVLTKISD